MLKKVVLIYISSRTILLAFYNIYPVPGIRVTDLVGFLFPILLFFFASGEKTNSLKIAKFQKFYFILFCYVLISIIIKIIFFDVRIFVIIKHFIKILNGFLIFFLFPKIFKNENDVKKLLNAFLISTIFPAIQILSQNIIGKDFLGLKTHVVSEDIQMYTGVYGNYGVFGLISWIGPLSIITLLAFVEGGNRKKLKYFIMFVLYLGIGVMTLSRTVVVVMVIVTIGLLAILLKRKNYGLIFTFSIMVSIYVLFTPTFKNSYQGVMARSGGEIEVIRGDKALRYSMHGRVGRWDEAVNSFLKDYSISQQMLGTDLSIGPHGDYITWLIIFGWIGVSLYILLIISLISKTWKFRRNTSNVFFKHYGTTALTGLIAWVLTAITTNPSLIPDFSYFVMGNVSIFISLYLKRLSVLRKRAS